jgi:hypothetical protein
MSADQYQYTESRLHNVLIEDHRVAEQGIQVVRVDTGFALVGEVESPQRRDAIMRVIGEVLPDVDVRCDIGVTRVHAPDEVEEL